MSNQQNKTTTVRLTSEQVEWIDEHSVSISKFVRKALLKAMEGE